MKNLLPLIAIMALSAMLPLASHADECFGLGDTNPPTRLNSTVDTFGLDRVVIAPASSVLVRPRAVVTQAIAPRVIEATVETFPASAWQSPTPINQSIVCENGQCRVVNHTNQPILRLPRPRIFGRR